MTGRGVAQKMVREARLVELVDVNQEILDWSLNQPKGNLEILVENEYLSRE